MSGKREPRYQRVPSFFLGDGCRVERQPDIFGYLGGTVLPGSRIELVAGKLAARWEGPEKSEAEANELSGTQC
jgi:hypothetical protein